VGSFRRVTMKKFLLAFTFALGIQGMCPYAFAKNVDVGSVGGASSNREPPTKGDAPRPEPTKSEPPKAEPPKAEAPKDTLTVDKVLDCIKCGAGPLIAAGDIIGGATSAGPVGAAAGVVAAADAVRDTVKDCQACKDHLQERNSTKEKIDLAKEKENNSIQSIKDAKNGNLDPGETPSSSKLD
jgi:hypothetical protein